MKINSVVTREGNPLMTQAKVGIFFVVIGDLIFDAVPLEQCDFDGDSVGYSGHCD